MTREQIMALEGRELDAAVAEHVMGYRRRIVPKDVDGKHGGTEVLVPASVDHDSFCYPPKGPIPFTFFVPHYSIDIAMAWQVVEHVTGRVHEVHVSYHPRDMWPDYDRDVPGSERWSCSIGSLPGTDMGWVRAHAPSAPEAICKAALLAHFTDVRAGKNGGGAE